MFTPRHQLQRLIYPFLFTIGILVLACGCSDDDCPTCPCQSCFDISGTVHDPGGDPSPRTTVFLGRDPDFRPMTAPYVVDSVMTDDAGKYDFNGLDVGTYRVYGGVWSGGGEGLSQVSAFSGPLDVSAKAAGNVANLNLLEMTADGVVTGEVFLQEEHVPAPVDSASVSLFRYEGADLVVAAETKTNAEGLFTLAGVETGNYTVTASKILDSAAPFPYYMSAQSEAFFCDGENPVQVERLILEDVMVEKPAVYLYPEEAGRFQVNLVFGEGIRLTASEPDYREGWDVFVAESGRIDDTWDYLFYEIAMRGSPLIEEGWCLSWSKLSAGLESLATDLQLNDDERDDFLSYWLSRLPRREYYEIHPVLGADLDGWVELDITPAPDSVQRFWLFFRGRDTAVQLNAPRTPGLERTGVTVVEWGGAIIP